MDTLNNAQFANEQAIILQCLQAGMAGYQTEFIVKVAYIESRFDQNATNPTSTASGTFQFLNGTWNTYFSDIGSKDSLANQVTAMIREVRLFTEWYNNPATNGNIPQGMTLEQYMYQKHHDGRGSTPSLSSPGVQIFNATDFNPKFGQITGQNTILGGNENTLYDVVWNDPMSGLAWNDKIPNVTAINIDAGSFWA